MIEENTMTYYESYREILRLNGTVEQVKEAVERDVRIAIFLGSPTLTNCLKSFNSNLVELKIRGEPLEFC